MEARDALGRRRIPDADRHIEDREPRPGGEREHFDFKVELTTGDGEREQVSYRIGAEPALRVTDREARLEAEPEVRETPAEAAAAGDVRADHVTLPDNDGLRLRLDDWEKCPEIVRVMLPVGIDRNHGCPAPLFHLVGRSEKGGSLAAVAPVPDDRDIRVRHQGAEIGIPAPVIDDQHVGDDPPAAERDIADGPGVVVRGDDDPDGRGC